MESLVNYKKYNNNPLFLELEKMGIHKTQNYMPLYKLLFALNDQNYNSINLNHEWSLGKFNNLIEDINKGFNCTIKNQQGIIKEKNVFIKKAPLLDPYYYVMGKYDIDDKELFTLPIINKNENLKINNPYNSSYVDGFFSFLTNQLHAQYKIVHGNEFYGSFVGYDMQYQFDVAEDLDYLIKSDFFIKNQNKLFKIDDYSSIFNPKLPPITISTEEDHFATMSDIEILDNGWIIAKKNEEISMLEFEPSIDINKETISLCKSSEYSNSTYSSRSSHTTNSDKDGNDMQISDNESDTSEDIESMSDDDSESSGSSCQDKISITLENFPIHLICTEKCDETLDYLINRDLIKKEEWFAILAQIIFTLIIYQKCFHFTHNDLHTENIMYVVTTKQFLYYKFNKKMYKIPTYGRIFKIIDFGRAIYKIKGNIICSDEFKTGGNAYGQYNCEPFLNSNKPRIDPNYSFDLCRLACCIFDYLIDDLDDIPKLINKNPLVKLINEWCRDDNGLLINYKKNGKERYSGFKYYKMIASKVHKHLPILQLDRKEFKHFEVNKIVKGKDIMNIDILPSFV